MSFPFQAQQGLILVGVEVSGPSGSAILQCALDTGATTTLINPGPLVALGYDPALAATRVQVTTGSGVEFVARIQLDKLSALGQERLGLPVLCHTLPSSAGIDGVLGLDFLRGQILNINFRSGQITLT